MPGWQGHIPLVSITLAVIALLAYFSLYILFTFGIAIIVISITSSLSTDVFDNNLNTNLSNDTNINSYDGYGYRAGNGGYGFYAGGELIDKDND